VTSNNTIVILTGAGISAESGLATFRDNNGLWCNHRIEDVATPEAFARDPALVHQFYNLRRAQLKEAKPNAAHIALAKLQHAWPGKVVIVTQNVDDLHERGGASVIHMHGELKKARCAVTEKIFDWEHEMSGETSCPACKKPGHMRPHIVWFGEMPLYMDAIYQALGECGLFVSIGTSGNVYPAAGFVQEVRANGSGHTVELNMEPSLGHSLFAEKIYGPASQIVPQFVEKLLATAP
jgi:NAD-dependent deacetylase